MEGQNTIYTQEIELSSKKSNLMVASLQIKDVSGAILVVFMGTPREMAA